MTGRRQVIRYARDVPLRGNASAPFAVPPIMFPAIALLVAGVAVFILILGAFLLTTIFLALAVFVFRLGRRFRTGRIQGK